MVDGCNDTAATLLLLIAKVTFSLKVIMQ